MKRGILDALQRAASTGEMPISERSQPVDLSGWSHATFVDQLKASVPSTSTHSPQASNAGQATGAGAGGVVYRPPSLGERARTGKFPSRAKVVAAAQGSGQPGTLESLFGPDPDAPEDRAAGAVLAAPAEAPVKKPAAPRGVRCMRCMGAKWVTSGAGQVPCPECGGRGRVAGVVPLPPDPEPEVVEDPVETALAQEVEQPLPLEEVTDAALVPMAGTEDPGRVAVGAVGDVAEPDPGAVVVGLELTYDLPVYVDELPAFCYVAGQAGVGKTWWAKALAANHRDEVVLAAPTGIAAVNLGEGTTINALLRFFNTQSLIEAFTGGWLEGQLKKLRGLGLRRILLDEVSMLEAEQLTIITRAIDNVNDQRGQDQPELGLLLVGDFAQLSPVNGGFAFESPEWDRFARETFKLETIRRQADRPFIEALQAVRRGDVDQGLAYFGPRLCQTTDMSFDGPTVMAKNDAVEKFNRLRMDRLQTPLHQFTSSRWGKVRGDWGGPPKRPSEWDIPETLTLKEGSRVMCLTNQNDAEFGAPPLYRYTNGDLGTFLGVEHGLPHLALDRTGVEVTVEWCERTNDIPLEPGRRKALREEGHEDRIIRNRYEAIGGITYVPLRLAYATTVHKAQGLTLTAVQVNIRDHFFSTPGMLYVALSRARTAEGLQLVGTLDGLKARMTVNPKIVPWL